MRTFEGRVNRCSLPASRADDDVPGAFWFQGMAATSGLAKGLEDRFRPISLDLADQREQFAQFSFGKAFLLEPNQIFQR